MKKSLFSLAGIVVLSAVFGWVVSAQLDISELFYDGTPLVDGAHAKILNEYDNSRWYSDSSSVSCDANDQVTITSPVVEDSTMDKANIYSLFISPYRVSQIKSWDPSVDVSKIIMKKVELGEGEDTARFTVSSSEVDPNTSYYGFISPADMFDVVGTPSKEICFKISNNTCLQDSACDSLNSHGAANESIEMHWAADCVWMDLANVTHTVNGDTITLKWTAVDWDVVQIAIFDPESEVYKSLWAVSMSDEKYDYTMQWDGEQNFMLTNGCKDLYYKADAKRWEKKPEKVVTPATWPAGNILYVAIAAIILYGAYLVFFRKAENK